MNQWDYVIQEAAETFTQLKNDFFKNLPYFLSGILVLIIGWLLAKGISYLVHKTLILLNVNRLSEKGTDKNAPGEETIYSDISNLASKITYWVILIFFIITASKIWGWTDAFNELVRLAKHVPKLLSGMVIFIVGLLLANFIRDLIRKVFTAAGITAAYTIGRFAFFVMLIIIGLTALSFIGVDVMFFSANIILITGSIALAFAIGFAVSSKDVLKNIIASSYNKKSFSTGQKIAMGKIFKIKGTIVNISNTNITIRSGNNIIIIPAKHFMDEIVEVEQD